MIEDKIVKTLNIQDEINHEVLLLLISLHEQNRELEEKINELYSRRTTNKH